MVVFFCVRVCLFFDRQSHCELESLVLFLLQPLHYSKCLNRNNVHVVVTRSQLHDNRNAQGGVNLFFDFHAPRKCNGRL